MVDQRFKKSAFIFLLMAGWASLAFAQLPGNIPVTGGGFQCQNSSSCDQYTSSFGATSATDGTRVSNYWCISNTSGFDIFVPTKTLTEFESFLQAVVSGQSNLAGITVGPCCDTSLCASHDGNCGTCILEGMLDDLGPANCCDWYCAGPSDTSSPSNSECCRSTASAAGAGETKANGTCPVTPPCGDAICSVGETPYTATTGCCEDCGNNNDSVCCADAGEAINNQLGCKDCADACGDLVICCADKPETSTNCCQDCGTNPNDGQCNCAENCGNSPADCSCGAQVCFNNSCCTPATCNSLGFNCGSGINNGCGGTLNCGSCTSPETCGGGGTPNVCGCTPTTCAAQGATCGTISDLCGGSLNCGSCTSPDTCGGGGTPGQCGQGGCSGIVDCTSLVGCFECVSEEVGGGSCCDWHCSNDSDIVTPGGNPCCQDPSNPIGPPFDPDTGGICVAPNCPAKTYGSGASACTVPALNSGQSGGSCAEDGSCQYQCNSGGLSRVSNTCNPWDPCTAQTIGTCNLTASNHGQSAGSCIGGYSGACSYTCTNGSWNPNSNSCGQNCTAPWGATVLHGNNVTAYQSSSVSCGSSCVSETRTCNNGSLSGSYTNQSCSVTACTCSGSVPNSANCAGYGSALTQNRTATAVSSCPGGGDHCAVTCINGYTASGGTCTCLSCLGWDAPSGGNLICCDGGPATDCTTCSDDGKTYCSVSHCTGSPTCPGAEASCGVCDNGQCDNSVVDGCTKGTPNNSVYGDTSAEWRWHCDDSPQGLGCSPSGVCSKTKNPCSATTVNGNCDVLATASGSTSGGCASGYTGSCSYTCDNGSWTTPSSNTCSAPCNLPWGGTIAHGNSVTAYLNASETCSGSCSSQTRTCNNGSLSGSYSNASCSATCGSNWCNGITCSSRVCASGTKGITPDAAVCAASGGCQGPCAVACNDDDYWYCTGCSPLNGVCNNAVQNGCSAGTANDGAYADTTAEWRWRCDGSCGGSNSGMCSKTKDPCGATTISNCDLTGGTASGNTSGSCASGYSGSCSYTCDNGSWTTPSSNTCSATCSGGVSDGGGETQCSIPPGTYSDGQNVSGVCSDIGNCSATCDNGSWSWNNTCVDDEFTCTACGWLNCGVIYTRSSDCTTNCTGSGVCPSCSGPCPPYTGECSSCPCLSLGNTCGNVTPGPCCGGMLCQSAGGNPCPEDNGTGQCWCQQIGPVCPDGNCDPPEDQCDCPQDCGSPSCPSASSVACGDPIYDICGTFCGTFGTGFNSSQCDAPSTVSCGTPINDSCGNSCGTTGTFCASGTCSGGVCSGGNPCPETIINDCYLAATAHNGSSGSCVIGYSGGCSYTCNNGSWIFNSNTCSPPPPPPPEVDCNDTLCDCSDPFSMGMCMSGNSNPNCWCSMSWSCAGAQKWGCDTYCGGKDADCADGTPGVSPYCMGCTPTEPNCASVCNCSDPYGMGCMASNPSDPCRCTFTWNCSGAQAWGCGTYCSSHGSGCVDLGDNITCHGCDPP